MLKCLWGNVICECPEVHYILNPIIVCICCYIYWTSADVQQHLQSEISVPALALTKRYQSSPVYVTSACSLQCGLIISLFKCKWDLWWFIMGCEVHRDDLLFSLCSSTVLCVCMCTCVCLSVCLSAGVRVCMEARNIFEPALTEGMITEWFLSFFWKPKISSNCLCKQPQTDLWGSQAGLYRWKQEVGGGMEEAALDPHCHPQKILLLHDV